MIPRDLLELPSWVAWRLEPRPGGERAKVPYVAAGRRADVWAATGATRLTYADAEQLAAREAMAGVGLVVSGTHDVFILDLDGCRDPESGTLAPWAAPLVDRLDSYTEVSPSGTGVKVFFRATKASDGPAKRVWRSPPGAAPLPGVDKRPGAELFCRGGYGTVTGNAVNGHASLRQVPDLDVRYVLDALEPLPGADPTSGARANAPRPPLNERLSDDEVLALAEREHPVTFHKLFTAGALERRDDDSVLDLRLCYLLARYVGGDPQRIDRLARRSALARPKWDARNRLRDGSVGTYLQRTIETALLGDPRAAADDVGAAAPSFRFLRAPQLRNEPEPPWLVGPNLIPQGALVVLYGPSKSGKSFLALDWALELAQGIEGALLPQPIVYVASEGWHGTRKRVDAWCLARGLADAPADALFMSGAVNLLHHEHVRTFLATARTELTRDPALIVLDTLSQNSAGGNENSPETMSAVVGACNLLRQETGATVMLIHHPRRQDEQERGHSMLGNSADTMLKLTVDQLDQHRVLECTKQKDAAEFEPRRFALVERGPSLVLEARAHPDPEAELGGQAVAVLEALRSGGLLTDSQWEAVATHAGVSSATYYRAKQGLLERGDVVRDGRKFRVATSDELTARRAQRAADGTPSF